MNFCEIEAITKTTDKNDFYTKMYTCKGMDIKIHAQTMKEGDSFLSVAEQVHF